MKAPPLKPAEMTMVHAVFRRHPEIETATLFGSRANHGVDRLTHEWAVARNRNRSIELIESINHFTNRTGLKLTR